MNIGIDIDGVLADIEPYVFEYGSKLLYDKGRSLEDIDREKYETYEIFKWNRDDEHEFWDKYMFNYYTKAPARIFASEVIKKLKEHGHNIYIITARGISEKELYSYLKDITKKWLKENDIYYDEIFFEKDKKKIKSISKKIEKAFNAMIVPVGHDTPINDTLEKAPLPVSQALQKQIKEWLNPED